MPSDNLNPSSAPREPGLSEAPSEEALLEALSDAADGFLESQLANKDNPEVADYWREEVALMLWLMEHLPRLLASSDRIAALEAENARLSADARRMEVLDEYLDSIQYGLRRTVSGKSTPTIHWFIGDGSGSPVTHGNTISECADQFIAMLDGAGPAPLAASRPADGAET